MDKKVKAAFLPNAKTENYDTKNTSQLPSDSENSKQNTQLLKKEDVQNFFSGYYFNIDEERTTKPTTNTVTAAPGGKEETD